MAQNSQSTTKDNTMERILYLSILVSTFIISGCSSIQQQLGDDAKYNTAMASQDQFFLDIERKTKTNNQVVTSVQNKKNQQIPVRKKIEDMTYHTNGYVKQYKKRRFSNGIVKQYNIVAEEMPVHEFLYYIFQDILKSDFVIDPKIKTIKEKITLKLTKRMSTSKLLDLLEDLLKSYNVEIVEKDGVFKAVYTNKFNDKTTDSLITSQTIDPDIPDDTKVAQYIQCDYINPNTLISLASGIFIKELTYKAIMNQNGIIVYGNYGYIKRLFNLKKIIDKPFMTNKKVTLVYFDYILPSDFKKQYLEILSYQNINTKNKDYIKLLPLDNIGALMVITSKNSDLNYLLSWKNKLDNIKKSNETQETYFYRSKYRSIKEIYALISRFNSPQVPVKLSAKSSIVSKDKNQETKKEFVKTKKSDIQIKKSMSASFGNSKENIRQAIIIPDEERNVLIIQATPAQYKKLLYILNKVDTQPLQLLVEANIIEVTLKDDLQYGMEWFLKNRLNQTSATGNPLYVSGKTNVGVGSGGFFGIVSNNYFNVVMNLFAKKNLIKILSHPKVLVLNGKSASIQVGQSIPILSSTMSNITNPENAVSTVQYSNTGVTLNVTPSVTANGVITMEISQTISKGQENGLSSISSPIIVNRNINTEIVLRDNQSVVMGGLIQHDVSDTRTKVPILGDIPGLKNLFSSTSKGSTRTELVLVVKIHIIDNFDLLDDVKDQFSQILHDNISESQDVSIIKNTHNITCTKPDVLISPENIDKYYKGELDKYYTEVNEQITPISNEKVKTASKKVKKKGSIAKKTRVDEDITKNGWVFIDDNIESDHEKSTGRIKTINGKKYMIDEEGDYVLVE